MKKPEETAGLRTDELEKDLFKKYKVECQKLVQSKNKNTAEIKKKNKKQRQPILTETERKQIAQMPAVAGMGAVLGF